METNAVSRIDSTELARARRCFAWTLAVTLVLKIWLAAAFPMTGDEAFFYQWGVFPAWGYSDHPPMVGWMLYLLNQVSSHPLALRSVTVLLWTLIVFGMMDLMRRLSPTRQVESYWLGALFLALPFTWAINLVTTDTPLILFIFASGYCFIRATLSGRIGWYAASGAFLGLALLSKYFAGLLSIAYFVYLVRHRRGWPALVLVAACALPFAAVNVIYNATHCWSNVMFNLINRNEDARWSVGTVAGYLAMMLYLVTPWVALPLLRARRLLWRYGAITVLFVVPFALFLVLSMKKTIGLHWVLGFMPFLFVFVGNVCDAQQLRKFFRWTAWFSLPHLLALAAIILLPVSAWQGRALHDDIVFHKQTGKIVSTLRADLPPNGAIMARFFTPASLLSYHAGEYLPVFGPGKFHSRQDDKLVDFRNYANRPVRIFDRREINPKDFAPYFDSVTVKSFEIDGVRFWYADGTNFNYPAYREGVLKKVVERYYQTPSFLPKYSCEFTQRYGFDY